MLLAEHKRKFLWMWTKSDSHSKFLDAHSGQGRILQVSTSETEGGRFYCFCFEREPFKRWIFQCIVCSLCRACVVQIKRRSSLEGATPATHRPSSRIVQGMPLPISCFWHPFPDFDRVLVGFSVSSKPSIPRRELVGQPHCAGRCSWKKQMCCRRLR